VSTENKKMEVLHQSGDNIIERVCQSRLVENNVGMLLDHFNTHYFSVLYLYQFRGKWQSG